VNYTLSCVLLAAMHRFERPTGLNVLLPNDVVWTVWCLERIVLWLQLVRIIPGKVVRIQLSYKRKRAMQLVRKLYELD
jgi:hypothetical protein